MFARILVMFSFLIIELAAGIMGFLAVSSAHPFGINEEGAALCVLISALMLISWLLTIAIFARKSARAKARRIITDATEEAASILSAATDKSLALCSLDAGRCRKCDNPRTGKYCPKCGTPAQALAV